MTADSRRTSAVQETNLGQPAYRRPPPGSQPNYLHPAYQATVRRAPSKPLILLPHTLSETTGPLFGDSPLAENDNDLTRQAAGEPLGERTKGNKGSPGKYIWVTRRVFDLKQTKPGWALGYSFDIVLRGREETPFE